MKVVPGPGPFCTALTYAQPKPLGHLPSPQVAVVLEPSTGDAFRKIAKRLLGAGLAGGLGLLVLFFGEPLCPVPAGWLGGAHPWAEQLAPAAPSCTALTLLPCPL